jgi:hypothetical protein
MRIGSISELTELNTHLSDLINTDTTLSGDLLIEVSKKQDGTSYEKQDGTSYDSKRFDLGKLCQQINQILISLQD